MIDNRIIEVAAQVRTACENFAYSDEAGLFDFYQDPSLGCMCAVASFTLKKKLDELGIQTELIHGQFADCSPHCWLTWQGAFIIDITATQFNHWVSDEYVDQWGLLQPVHVVPIDDEFYFPAVEVKDYDFFKDWTGQEPSEGLVERILELV